MRDRKTRGMMKSMRGRTLSLPKGALTHHSRSEWWNPCGGVRSARQQVNLKGQGICQKQTMNLRIKNF